MKNLNSRKLIGTIIGVIFFAILIIGATFAWLILGVNVTNGRYNSSTWNFTVNYTTGNDVTSLPVLYGDIGSAEYINAGGQVISGDAYKGNLDGRLFIKLHVNDTLDNDALLEAECIRYATYYSDSLGALAGVTLLSDPYQRGILSAENVDSNGDIIIYAGALLERDRVTPAYYIYLWIDNELATNDLIGLSFSGYVHAYAIQDHPDR